MPTKLSNAAEPYLQLAAQLRTLGDDSGFDRLRSCVLARIIERPGVPARAGRETPR